MQCHSKLLSLHFNFLPLINCQYMWQRLGNFVIRYRLPLLIILFACTAVMGYFGSKVKLSYEFAKAIPKR